MAGLNPNGPYGHPQVGRSRDKLGRMYFVLIGRKVPGPKILWAVDPVDDYQ